GLLGRLARARPPVPRLWPRARLQGGTARLGRAHRADRHQGVRLRPHRYRRHVARALRHLPRRCADWHRHRVPEVRLRAPAAAFGDYGWTARHLIVLLLATGDPTITPPSCF